MPIRPKPKGKYEADYQNKKAGISRIRETFDTKQEAEEWLTQVKYEAHNRKLGRRERHLFGEALSKYIDEESPKKNSCERDIEHAKKLRTPIKSGNRWIYLEQVYCDDIVPALSEFITDFSRITRRRYLWRCQYRQYNIAGKLKWYIQPDCSETPQQRILITDKELIKRLDEPGGRGPYSTGTLRLIQGLVSIVLRTAWRKWDWLEHDLAGKIIFEPPSKSRKQFLNEEQVELLANTAANAKKGNQYVVTPDPVAPHFADLIYGAAWIGWRKSNIVYLEWERVVFPVFSKKPDTGEMIEVQPGVIWVEGKDTKNGADLAQPMSSHLYELLKKRWECRISYVYTVKDEQGKKIEITKNYVFHRGDGKPFGDFKKRFKTAVRKAGLDPSFRWHDLRHTWASILTQCGISEKQLQQLGGWKERRMIDVYAHLRIKHLRNAVELPNKNKRC